jgi:hypothetical protein
MPRLLFVYTAGQEKSALVTARAFACPGVTALDIDTPYHSDAGVPLVTAPQAAEIGRVDVRTIYKRVSRGKLDVAGLGKNGEQLFDAADIALLGRRRPPAPRGIPCAS